MTADAPDRATLMTVLRAGATPRHVLEAVDRLSWLPEGTQERVHGWGVMGQPFDTEHVLGLRRWSASSVGPAYTTLWHRSPQGRWTFWSTEPPEVSCNRYAGECVDDTATTDIAVTWLDDDRFTVDVPAFAFGWEVRLATTPMAQALNAVALRLPDRVGRSSRTLRVLGPAAGRLLRSGGLGITGGMPNGQAFAVTPYRLWLVAQTRATLRGESLGRPAPLPVQARIGDFRIPQRGLVAVGSLFLDPLDPERHSTRVTRDEDGAP